VNRGIADVCDMRHRNLSVELFKMRSKRNVVQARSFAELLEQAVCRYQNRAIETAQVIKELIQLAKDMREANVRGEALKLNEDELAFYDALEVNDSAVKVLGELTLVHIARDVGGGREEKRQHRLDRARKRARPTACDRQAYPAQIWLPTR